jgi:hypothetical protein
MKRKYRLTWLTFELIPDSQLALTGAADVFGMINKPLFKAGDM